MRVGVGADRVQQPRRAPAALAVRRGADVVDPQVRASVVVLAARSRHGRRAAARAAATVVAAAPAPLLAVVRARPAAVERLAGVRVRVRRQAAPRAPAEPRQHRERACRVDVSRKDRPRSFQNLLFLSSVHSVVWRRTPPRSNCPAAEPRRQRAQCPVQKTKFGGELTHQRRRRKIAVLWRLGGDFPSF